MKKYPEVKILTKLSSLVLVFTLLFSAMALCSFAASAEEEFIQSVEGLDSISDSNEWAAAVYEAVQKWEAYEAAGGAADANARVAAAYAVFVTERDIYDSCNTFLDNSIEIESAGFDRNPYEVQAEIYEQSNAIYVKYKENNKFMLFAGISTAVIQFNDFAKEFLQQRTYCKTYVESAALAAAAKNYANAKKYIDLAAEAKKKIEITEYPGMETAAAQINEAKKFISASMNTAVPFIQAVQAIADAENGYAAMIAALSAYKSVDPTAEGVSASYADLLEYVENYNAAVSAANAVAKNVNSSALGLIP